MTEQNKTPEAGIDLEKVSFDTDGKIVGLADDVLDSISGGLMDESMEPGDNGACGNTANGAGCK